MKLTILNPLSNVGIITEVKPVISEANIIVDVVGEVEGTLTVGQRSYAVKNSVAKIPEYELVIGESPVNLITNEKTYACGALIRNGRFLKVDNKADKLIIACAFALADQAKQIDNLKRENKAIRNQYGVEIV